jgi:hypothetical protein
MSYVLLYTEKNKVRENLLQHVHPLVSLMKYSTLYGLGLFARISAATLLLLFILFLSSPQLGGTVVPGATNDLVDLLKRSRRDPQWVKALFGGADLVVFRDEFHKSSALAVEQKLHANGRPQMRCAGQDWLYFCR